MLEVLPLTPSGKVDRRALLTLETATSSSQENYVAPATPTEETLAHIWAEVLRLKQVGIHDNFFELGGDSILSIQVVTRANQAGLKITPRQLFQHQTIAELASVAGTQPTTQAGQGFVTGFVPFTAIQHWFFEQNRQDPHHFNQSVLFEVSPAFEPAFLELIIRQWLMHHDALRLRFVQKNANWQQVNADVDETVPFNVFDLSALPASEQKHAIEMPAAELQASLNFTEGPLLRVAFFHLGAEKRGRLLFIIHHLAVDGVSWRILLEDLQTAYQQLGHAESIAFLPKTTSFKEWAGHMTDYAQSNQLQEELDYWLDSYRAHVAPLPVDKPTDNKANTVASAAQVSVSLSSEQTRALLQEVPSAYNTQIQEVLLTALVQTFTQWIGERFLLVDLEGHGREELFENIDLSRTVGWFTSLFPVLLDLGSLSQPGEAIKSIKEQLRRIPQRGIGYGLLRYLSQDTATRQSLQALPQAEVIFNYLGQFDQVLSETSLISPAKESVGTIQSPRDYRHHLLEINSSISENQLQLVWTYSENIHFRQTIEDLTQDFIMKLNALITHCQSPDAGGYTPSDFPGAKLSPKNLDKFISKIHRK
jgi:non-ribosomal peptide synthase protein (TIGR01720 family)